MLATPLFAQETIRIHFSGYGYEAGGFDMSDPGDELHLMSNITSITGPDGLPYFPGTYQYTLVVTGLISNGEIDLGGGLSQVTFNLGDFAIYEDDLTPSDWNEYPSIPDPPDSFMDGSVWLSGPFIDFTMDLFRDFGQGAFEGHIELTGGSAIAWFTEDAYTFGGTLIPPHNPGIPDGYDLSVDGEVNVSSVATENSTMSQIKALY